MLPATKLIIFDLGFTLTIVATIGLGLFVFFNSPRQARNTSFLLFTIALAIFEASIVIGVNITNSTLAHLVFLGQMAAIFVPAFNAHWIFVVVEKDKQLRKSINIIYVLAGVIFLFFAIFPNTYISGAAPVSYFPNYFIVGPYHIISVLYILGVLFFILFNLTITYAKANSALKNRIDYFWASFFFGYGTGMLPIFFAYGLFFDPIYSVMMSLYAVPIGYAMLRYDLMSIEDLAKQAIQYSLLVGVVAVLIVATSSANALITSFIPAFPTWVVPLIIGFIAVWVGNIIWKKVREVDKLKYEFITVMTHKFRTPLTRIKWSTDTMTATATEEEKQNAIQNIRHADEELFVLTNTILGLTKTDTNQYVYHFTPASLGDLMRDIIESEKESILSKKLQIKVAEEPDIPMVSIDVDRMKLALHVLLENAIAYTPDKGAIDVTLSKTAQEVILTIKDSGIGIPANELKYVYTKFFRGSNAKLTDTGGVGIGLYMAKDIVNKNHGELSLDSEGDGKGTLATVKIIYKNS